LGRGTAALAVDAVLDVRALGAAVVDDIPPLLREVGADLAAAIGALDAKLLLVLEAARLVPESLWNSIETRGLSG
jgi:purine-binding chemotaxis protein CheW